MTSYNTTSTVQKPLSSLVVAMAKRRVIETLTQFKGRFENFYDMLLVLAQCFPQPKIIMVLRPDMATGRFMFISLLSSNSSIIVSVLCLSFIAFIVFAFI